MPRCVCLVCRAHFVAVGICLDDDGCAMCPVCGHVGIELVLDITFYVAPESAASVRASVWGRAN